MIRVFLYAALIAGIVAIGLHFGRADSVFNTGFMRPPGYFAQAVAIVAVGVLATQLGGSLYYITPALFLALMAGGAFLALRGLRAPDIDMGAAIAVSVLVLGLVVALIPRPEAWVALILAAIFGLAHGYQIGAATPNFPRMEIFFVGFLMSALGLILVGMLLRELLDRVGRSAQGRALLGAAIFGIGLHMVLQSYHLI